MDEDLSKLEPAAAARHGKEGRETRKPISLEAREEIARNRHVMHTTNVQDIISRRQVCRRM